MRALIDAIANTHFQEACEYEQLDSQCKEMQERLELIKQLCYRDILDWPTQGLMLTWFDIEIEDLQAVLHRGQSVSTIQQWEVLDLAVTSQCHAMAAFHWVMNPRWTIYTGFSDKTHFHSWLIDDRQRLCEPTPILRDTYYGYPHHQPLEFVEHEYKNIQRLFSDALLPSALKEDFENRYRSLIQA